ncbi:MAG: chromate transporter [Polaromonas sp.]|nr:chromate transporter [Polaromonas sp.]
MSDLPLTALGALGWRDWLDMLVHFMTLSLLSVGGTISTAPDMHRFLVDKQNWLTDAQFNASIALAQAAPGPNVLWVALLGWHVGMNSGGMGSALLGVLVAMAGILVPSSILTYSAAKWGQRNRELRAVRAFKQGMAPIVVALILATGWVLTLANSSSAAAGPWGAWPIWLLTGATALIVWRTRLHLLWLLGAGALLGGLGWI